MRLRHGCVWMVLLAWLLSVGHVPAAEPAGWRVGTAKTKITPDKPLWLAGYGGRTHPAEGTQHDLWVKALALEAPDGGQAVVVSSDLLGFPKGISDKICDRLATRCHLSRDRIMLTSSHTHCGPVLQDALYDVYPLDANQRALIKEYSEALVEKVAATAVEALGCKSDATLWAGEGKTPFAVNRRNNKEPEITQCRARGEALVGPNDHSVPVLAVRTPQGFMRSVVFGYACHNTTLNFYQYCGDYSGFAQLALEEKFPKSLAMFYMGCGADQNPLPRRSVELCQQYGQMLANAVEHTASGASMRALRPRLRTAWATIELGFGEQPTREELQELAKKKTYQARSAARLLREMDGGKPLVKSYPAYPIQVWKLGDDQLWIVLGGEVVVDYSLRFKTKYGPRTWVTGYANYVMSYIPSHRIWEEGKYEAGAFSVYGLPANRWVEDIEERIAACVDQLVTKVK